MDLSLRSSDGSTRHAPTRACAQCGYDLTGLHTAGRCPECGAPMVDRPRTDLLAQASRPWLRQVLQGMRLAGIGAWAAAAWTITTIALLTTSLLVRHLQGHDLLASFLLSPIFGGMTILLVACACTALIRGVHLFALPEPNPDETVRCTAQLPILRRSVWGAVIFVALYFASVIVPSPGGAADRLGFPAVQVLILGGLGLTVGLFVRATTRRLADLLHRVPAPALRDESHKLGRHALIVASLVSPVVLLSKINEMTGWFAHLTTGPLGAVLTVAFWVCTLVVIFGALSIFSSLAGLWKRSRVAIERAEAARSSAIPGHKRPLLS
jgi:uncharacterized membrane protein